MVQNVVVLVDQIGERVADGDIALAHADFDKLPHQGDDHLRRGVHVILALDQGIGLGIHRAFAKDHPHPVRLDDEFLAAAVARIALAAGAVEMPEQLVPRLGHGGLARHGADRLRHHRVDAVLAGVLRVVQVSVPWPLPAGGQRIVDPDHSPRVDTLCLADGLDPLRLVRPQLGRTETTQSGGAANRRGVLDKAPPVDSLCGERVFQARLVRGRRRMSPRLSSWLVHSNPPKVAAKGVGN